MLLVPECPSFARLARDGVVLTRFENEERLYCGMKDLHAFLVIDRGSSELWHRGNLRPVRPGDLVLAEPGEIYRDQSRAGPATFDLVLFNDAHVETARRGSQPHEAGFTSPVLAAADPRARALLALHASLSRPVSALARDVALANAAAALIDAQAQGTTERRSERPVIARARQYLRERTTERIRLDELADHVGYDKYHLIRAFRVELGVPPYEYVTQLRMVRARELLRNGMTPANVAAALGYFGQSQLHRHFLRIVGTTPGAFAACVHASRSAPVERAREMPQITQR